MASRRLKPLYAIKECSSCGSLYTRECWFNRKLENKILVPEPESSPCCAKCGKPVDGPYCRGCAFLRKKIEEDLLTYCGENETFKYFEDISESSDDNTNVVNAPREPFVVNQDPGVKPSQDPPQIDHNCCYECGDSLDGIFCQRCICKSCGKGAHYGYNCPPKDSIIFKPEPCNQTINEIPQTLPSLDPSCYSLPHVSKPNFVDNSLIFSYPPLQPQFETYSFRGEEIDEEYERDCEIRIQKLKQDFNEWGSEVRKKEQAYEEEKYSAARRYMLSITCDDEDDSIPLGDIMCLIYNLALFILKRMETIRHKPKLLLPYGMLLTRLFNHVVSNFPELEIDRYILYDRVMHPLAPHYEQKKRSDHGTKRCRDSNASSSSTALNHSSSSHHLDENDEESSHSSTPSFP
ncbi:hypothetical protein Tco_0668223 [Tanacetum coccineum]